MKSKLRRFKEFLEDLRSVGTLQRASSSLLMLNLRKYTLNSLMNRNTDFIIS